MKVDNYKFFILMFFMILLVGTISAYEFDNIKEVPNDFDMYKDSITIRNSFLQLFPLGKVADVKLIYNTGQVLIKGEAIFELTLYGDYSNPISNIEFYDKENKKVTSVKNVKWSWFDESEYEVEVLTYSEVCKHDTKNNTEYCTQEVSGTKKEKRQYNIWREYKGEDFVAGTYRFKLIANKLINSEIDFIPELFGVKLPEFAWWNAAWAKEKQINITNNAATEMDNYTISLNIEYASSMASDFKDLRFVNGSKTGELGYFIVNKTDGDSALIDVMIMNMTASAIHTIYMYYGNPSVIVTTSDGDEAYNFYDNFSLTNTIANSPKWTEPNYAGGTINNSMMNLSQHDPSQAVSAFTLNQSKGWQLNYRRFFLTQDAVGDVYEFGFGGDSVTTSNYVYAYFAGENNNHIVYQNGVENTQVGLDWNYTTWIYDTINFALTNTTWWINGSARYSRTGENNLLPASQIVFGNRGGGSNPIEELYITNVSLRRFVYPEPTYSFSSEFSNSENPSLNVTLVAPTDAVKTKNVSLVFNTTISYEDIIITNTTLFIWTSTSSLVGSNYSAYDGNNASSLSLSGFTTIGTYSWNNYWCGENATSTLCDFSVSNYSFIIIGFEESGEYYNNTLVYETESQTFGLNITTLGNVVSVNAKLNYNSTEYEAEESFNGTFAILTSTIDIPLVEGDFMAENKTFFWNITTFDGTSSYSSSTTELQHNVSRIYVEKCNATYTNKSLNFTTYDEQNLSRLKFKFYSTISFWLGSGSVYRNNSYSNSSTDEYNLCVKPAQEFKIRGLVEYDSVNESVVAYTKRDRYFDNYTINSTMKNIELLLLQSSSSTTFIQEVLENQVAVPNAHIYTYRYYSGTDEWKLIQSGITDNNGKIIAFYEAETTLYKHKIVLDSIIKLEETTGRKIIPEDTPYTITFELFTSVQNPLIEYDDESELTWTLTYNNLTSTITYTYTDVNISFASARLYVVNENYATSDVMICNSTSVLSSASLTCNVASYEGQSIARAYITRNSIEKLIDTIGFYIGVSGKDIFGNTGMILAFFILLVASTAFLWNPIVGVIAVDISLIFINLIGLVDFGRVFLFGIIAVSIIFIWLVRD